MSFSSDSEGRAPASREEQMSALFGSMIVQHTNMAFMFLGQTPHPETGQIVQDFDHARSFIDQLEMLEVKTKGNLDGRETALLKESLTRLRMAFVDAVSKQKPATEAVSADGVPVSGEESHKKFSKKY